MRSIIVALLFLSSVLAGGPSPALATTIVAGVCDGPVPEEWRRPGGFCAQNDFNHSLTDPGTDNAPGCTVVIAERSAIKADDRTHVAVGTACCPAPVSYEFDPITNRAIVAGVPCLPPDPCKFVLPGRTDAFDRRIVAC